MEIRRIVTGHTPDGKATFIEDGIPPRTQDFKTIPGMRATLAWATDCGVAISAGGADPTPAVTDFVPSPGSTRCIIMQFPPDSVYGSPDFDPPAAGAENMEIVPGLAERFEPDAPGMHTTDSVDYAIVLEGEPVLELHDGQTRALTPGHVV